MTQIENAQKIWNYLLSKSWTQNAIAAMLGNMQSESGIIPDQWENDEIGNINVGYGLVQWTPASKYINWAESNGLDYKDIISQCKRIEWEVENNQQFSSSQMTFEEFSRNTNSPEYLAEIFLTSYERPANPDQPNRKTQARYWFDKLRNYTGKKVVDWFNENRGKITYSMDGSRIGTDGTADCSGSMTIAMYNAWEMPYDMIYSTVNLSSYLKKCDYTKILTGNMAGTNLNQIGDEDIILFSEGNSMADSGGAGGHTGVVSGGGKNLTSTCYLTHGEPNTAIQDVPLSPQYLKENGFNYYEVWRIGEAPTPPTPPSFSDNVHYGLRVLNGSWLDEVINFNEFDDNGYAGLPFHSHDLLYMSVDNGDIRYRVHTTSSDWLPWVTKGDPNDPINGCAGNPGEAIDGVQVYYITDGGEVMFQSYYRSQTVDREGWLTVCCDDGTSVPGYDGWAGILGEPLDRLQIGISYDNPF